MMKKQLRILFLLMAVGCLVCCGKKADTCDITVTVGFPEYTLGYLAQLDGSYLDSLRSDSGSICIVRNDCQEMPYVAFVHMENPEDSLDFFDMPVVVEPGEVRVVVDEYITVDGTPLNKVLQQFLDELQLTSVSIRKKGVTVREMQSVYSAFYRQQILLNKDNVVGDFIYHNYGTHLNEADLQSVKTVLGKQ